MSIFVSSLHYIQMRMTLPSAGYQTRGSAMTEDENKLIKVVDAIGGSKFVSHLLNSFIQGASPLSAVSDGRLLCITMRHVRTAIRMSGCDYAMQQS